MQTKRIAVLASSEGTILQSFIDNGIEISLVICDRNCGAYERAKLNSIATAIVPFTERKKFSLSIKELLLRHKVDVVASAGFGRILDEVFFENINFLVLNSHPSIKYVGRGYEVVQRAINNKDEYAGTQIQRMSSKVDLGEVLVEVSVKIEPNDTVESLWERIKVQERHAYPALLRSLAFHTT